MRPKTITFTMAVLDRNGVCEAQAPGGAINLTINGALTAAGVATFAVSRAVSIYAAADNSAKTFTVYGTDRYGTSISNAIAGPTAGASVGTTVSFKTVTRVAISAASVGNVEVGSFSTADTAWYPVDHVEGIVLNVTLSSAAAFTYTVQTTNSNVFSETYTEGTMTAFDEFQGVASEQIRIDHACRAVRLQITNWTSASDTATTEIVVPREV